MAAAGGKPTARERGSIRRHRDRFQVRVSAGTDPATGERLDVTGSVLIEKPGNERSERDALKQAEKLRTRLLAEADELKLARTKSTFGALLDRWLAQHEIDPTTRMTYEQMVRDHIRPVLGDVPLMLLVRDASQRLEKFYAELRRCRVRCDGKVAIDHRVKEVHECRVVRHKYPPGRRPAGGHRDHDCTTAGCEVRDCSPHRCQPYAASSVRQVHAIISGALSAAVRWNWIPYNPASGVRLPSKPIPQPRPPSSAAMAQIISSAFETAHWWGTYLWLSAVTGARRGEVTALQREDIDFEASELTLNENWVRGPGGMVLKDTKTHQGRRLSLDIKTAALLRDYLAATELQLDGIGLAIHGKTWLFSARVDFSRPRDPSSLSRKYSGHVERLGISTHLKELRHYSATELLAAGVDLRTVAGRLGHRDGTTTLRHYAGWVGASDKAAAKTIASRMPE